MSKDFNLLHIAEGFEVPRDTRSQMTRPRSFARDRDLHQRNRDGDLRPQILVSRPRPCLETYIPGKHAKLLIHASESLAFTLAQQLYQSQFYSGVVPKEWTLAMVTPICKKGKSNDMSKYAYFANQSLL